MFLVLLLAGALSTLSCGTKDTGPSDAVMSPQGLENSEGLTALGMSESQEFETEMVEAEFKPFPPILRPGDLVLIEYAPRIVGRPMYAHLDLEGFDNVAVHVGGTICLHASPLREKVCRTTVGTLRSVSSEMKFARVSDVDPDLMEEIITKLWNILYDNEGYQDIRDFECVDPGEPFGLPVPGDSTWPYYRDRWYNSEYVWAAFYHNNIDLGNVGPWPPSPDPCVYVSPQDIADDDDVEILAGHIGSEPVDQGEGDIQQ
jgi:hypothetical protein